MTPSAFAGASSGATIRSALLLGASARRVEVSVGLSPGTGAVEVVGLGDTGARELRDRVRAAFLSCGLPWPLARLTVDVTPTAAPPSSTLDLAVAMGILTAAGTLPAMEGCAAFGELGLDGSVRPVAGAVPLAEALADAATLVVPEASAGDVGLVTSTFRTARSLAEVARWHLGSGASSEHIRIVAPAATDDPWTRLPDGLCWPLEVAAAGGHHLLVVGSVSAVDLAGAVAGLLRPLDQGDAVEVARVHSAAGLPLPDMGAPRPPVRAPHTSASATALLGGAGRAMRPGELSLAHNGILALDDLTNYGPAVLDGLRGPLDDGTVTVRRGDAVVSLPARIQLVATMQPCPCGRASRECVCTDAAKRRHAARAPGWLLERLEIKAAVRDARGPSGPDVADAFQDRARRVASVRARARRRGAPTNARLPGAGLDSTAPLTPDAAEVLARTLRSGAIDQRATTSVRRVARTLADLDGLDGPALARHVVMALGLRQSVPTTT